MLVYFSRRETLEPWNDYSSIAQTSKDPTAQHENKLKENQGKHFFSK